MNAKKPSYLDYVTLFWRVNECESLNPAQTRLYFLLLHLNNRNGWQKEVIISDTTLASQLGVSPNTFRRARIGLEDRELIKFIIGGRGFADKSRYQLRVPTRVSSRVPSSIQNLKPTLYIDKIKNKSKNNYIQNGESKGFNISAGDFE